MKKIKKLFLSFGSLGAVIITTASIISCGNQIINNEIFWNPKKRIIGFNLNQKFTDPKAKKTHLTPIGLSKKGFANLSKDFTKAITQNGEPTLFKDEVVTINMTGSYTYQVDKKNIVVNYVFVIMYKYNAKNTLSKQGIKSNLLDSLVLGIKNNFSYESNKTPTTKLPANLSSLMNMFLDKGKLIQNTNELLLESNKIWKKMKKPYTKYQTPRTAIFPTVTLK